MLLNNNNAVASPFSSTGATAYDTTSGTDSTSSSSTDSSTSTATITADDFLQLLVTELQNQDPTANTDPNEYVDQLVQVNSLQQLISINEDLTPSTTTSTGDAIGSTPAADSVAGTSANGGATDATGSTAHANAAAHKSIDTDLSPAQAQQLAAEQSRLHPSQHTGNLSANVDQQSTMAASATRVASSLLPRRQERVTSPGTSAITTGRFSAH